MFQKEQAIHKRKKLPELDPKTFGICFNCRTHLVSKNRTHRWCLSPKTVHMELHKPLSRCPAFDDKEPKGDPPE